jgi:DNA-binding response OmpR family regulator
MLDSHTSLTVRGVQLNLAAHTATVKGRTVALPLQEFRLLHELMRQAGQVLSVRSLLEGAWSRDVPVDAGTIKVHIMRLRKKIEPDFRVPTYIRTVRHCGYIFDVETVTSSDSVT